MSLLKKTRKRAAEVLWSKTGHLGSQIQQLIKEESALGKTHIAQFPVAPQDYSLGLDLIEVLRLEGFYASWHNDGHHAIDINWEVYRGR